MTSLELPDEPRWVEAHGIAADPASWRRELGRGFALGHDGARLVVIADGADPAAAAGLAREFAEHAVLVAADELAAALRHSGRGVERARLHTLPDPASLPFAEGAVRLRDDASLAHLPDALVGELIAARARGPVWTAPVDGQPCSFSHAPWRSARFFDISVDTLESVRRRGLAMSVASALIRHERAAGREPVWGAEERNVASLRLAQRLGFELVDQIWIAEPFAPLRES